MAAGGELSQDEFQSAFERGNSRRRVVLPCVHSDRDRPEQSQPVGGTQVARCRRRGHFLVGRTGLSIHGGANAPLPFTVLLAVPFRTYSELPKFLVQAVPQAKRAEACKSMASEEE